MPLSIVVSVCICSGGQLFSLKELWSIVSGTLKVDVSSTDLWKVVTQQVLKLCDRMWYFKRSSVIAGGPSQHAMSVEILSAGAELYVQNYTQNPI